MKPTRLHPATDRGMRQAEGAELVPGHDAAAPRSEPGDLNVELPLRFQGTSTLISDSDLNVEQTRSTGGGSTLAHATYRRGGRELAPL
jgi:hypothetical protein